MIVADDVLSVKSSVSLRSPGAHLLVLPVPMRVSGGTLLCEEQAVHGMERWLDHFESLIVASPLIPEEYAKQAVSMTWVNPAEYPWSDRVRMVPLPYAYRVQDFINTYRRTRNLLRELVSESRYLQFAIGTLIGDWAVVAAEQAIQMGRKYALHVDNVGHEYGPMMAKSSSALRRLKAQCQAPLMKMWHKRLFHHAALALCNGSDTYQAYRDMCDHAFRVYNVHIKAGDRPDADSHLARMQATRESRELRVCYAGRMASEKAPLDWVRAIAHARDQGVSIQAEWIGDGEMRPRVEEEIQRLGVGNVVSLPGWVRDERRLLNQIHSADVFLFTHILRESPRCLMEALVCGTPIVGYSSDYPLQLIARNGGGVLTVMHDWRGLGDTLVELSRDRTRLVALREAAYLDGEDFNAESVFAKRSDLIRQFAG